MCRLIRKPCRPKVAMPRGFKLGSTDRYLFLYLEVDDPHIVAEPLSPHPEDRFDRVNLTVERPGGARETYFFATGAPGPIEAQTVIKGADGIERPASEPRIQAFWLQTSRGYHLEARVPLSLMGPRLWIQALDGAGGKSGFVPLESAPGGRLFMTTPGLDDLLATFIRHGTRATVVDANDLKLGMAGAVSESEPGEDDDAGGTWYRRFVTVDTSAWPLKVSGRAYQRQRRRRGARGAPGGGVASSRGRPGTGAPRRRSAAGGRHVHGAVVLEQGGDQILELRDRALTHLFNLTLLATALAVLFAFSVATLISLRIGRLRTAADSAVGNDGSIRLEMPESRRPTRSARSPGDSSAARRASTNIRSIFAHWAGKLAHELERRSPSCAPRSTTWSPKGCAPTSAGSDSRPGGRIASAIDPERIGGCGPGRRKYQASRAGQFRFVSELLDAAVAGYRDAFPSSRFELDVPADACPFWGAPDLIAQMLDKLVENAVDFCPASGSITVRLARAGSNYELSVANDGPPIPEAMLGRLFESLFEHREGRDDRPHFGLGLYIVRLIAEFHGGKRARRQPERRRRRDLHRDVADDIACCGAIWASAGPRAPGASASDRDLRHIR